MPALALPISLNGGFQTGYSHLAPRLQAMGDTYNVYPNWMFEDLTYVGGLQPTGDKQPIPVPDRVYFDGPYCMVGLWRNSFGSLDRNSWVGWALGAPDLSPEGNPHTYWDNIRDNKNGLSGQCNNLKDLNGNLPRELSSFKVTGYCECEFFADEDCRPESSRFSAYNREDAAMWRNGKDDNTIQSIKCRYAESWGGVGGFAVTFVDNKTARRADQVAKSGSPMIDGISLSGTWSAGILRVEDSKKCLRVGHPDVESGNFRITDVDILHATCLFYLDGNCNETGAGPVDQPFLTLASTGKTGWVDPDRGENWGKNIRSYKCFAGYNIAWHHKSQDALNYIKGKIEGGP
ncbi:hypothetical protein TWF481_001937 [Arthrobotrys musiformis]|uniref:Uncharacterized protein n=1 Tax=Arthrobotrys musiformis TaxID=47236 RepID=A0AAV9VXK3_9PEZI